MEKGIKEETMTIGVPKEIKIGENRVALTPAGARVLTREGHVVVMERGAGAGSGLDDAQFEASGAEVVASAEEVWGQADLVLKVKEPLSSEVPFFREGLLLFTYLHLAACPDLTRKLMETGVTAIAYETIQEENGELPLLAPMSKVAGRMAVQVGARALEAGSGGRGVLLGGVPGVPPAQVVVLGGGVVGMNADKIAVRMGANPVRHSFCFSRLGEIFSSGSRDVLFCELHFWVLPKRNCGLRGDFSVR